MRLSQRIMLLSPYPMTCGSILSLTCRNDVRGEILIVEVLGLLWKLIVLCALCQFTKENCWLYFGVTHTHHFHRFHLLSWAKTMQLVLIFNLQCWNECIFHNIPTTKWKNTPLFSFTVLVPCPWHIYSSGLLSMGSVGEDVPNTRENWGPRDRGGGEVWCWGSILSRSQAGTGMQWITVRGGTRRRQWLDGK